MPSDEKEHVAHDSKSKVQNQLNINLISGLFSGISCAGIFNPWDRALYLSVKYKRPFILSDNFKVP